ncbi:DUF397 domain-containing protein [Streptomyces sp. YGL11-2]|uniref:DUF397 domain-containing protein n=1 Tax=Streptomyces sp. YGL11-2 TaxID=3414028 RepID=UPI003CE9665B
MIPDLDLATATWIKSSYSEGNGGACIEFSPAHSTTHGVVPVRDSKVPGGPAIVVCAAGWSSFVATVKNGGLPS